MQLITGFYFCPKAERKKLWKKSKKVLTNCFEKCIIKTVPLKNGSKKVHWKVNKKSFKKPSGNVF